MAAQLNALNPRNDPALNPNYPTTKPEYMSSDSWTGIMTAWCGACYDPLRDEMHLPHQGGHADYAGNDALILALNDEAPYWRRTHPPSGHDGSVTTDDRPKLQAGSSGSTVVLAGVGTGAPAIYGGVDAASDVDDFYNGMTIGVFAESNRTITAYNGTTKVATVNTPYSGDKSGRQYFIGLIHGQLGEMSGRLSDGRARAIHSYNKPVWVPTDDAAWTPITGNVSWSGSAGNYLTVRIDRVTGAHTIYGPTTSEIATAPSGGGACYDSLRDAIWWRGLGGGKIGRFDLSSKTWVSYTSASIAGPLSLTYLADHDCIFIGNNATADCRVWDCATNTSYTVTVTGAGADGLVKLGSTQPVFVPAMNALVWWHNASNTTQINYMTVPTNPRTGTWTIQQMAVDGSNAVTPDVANTNGTYGRFAYSPNMDGFVLTHSVHGPVWFFART